MSVKLSAFFRSLGIRMMSDGAVPGCSQLRYTSYWIFTWMGGEQKMIRSRGPGMFPLPFWHHQQVRYRKRGTEYQPNNIKRKRTHGWIKRISTRGGIEVLLRRMLKGRKSLSH